MQPLILLVEDEAAIALSLQVALEDGGYAISPAGSGEEALAIIDEQAQLSGVITDIRLGDGPSGWDVARHARRNHPSIPLVYMSGDSAADHTSEGVPGSVMVQKPYAMAQVIIAISTLLNEASPPSE
jgi:CheY-like chemotaxis protein